MSTLTTEAMVQELHAKQAITELIHLSSHAMDRLDMQLLDALLHDDAQFDMGAIFHGDKQGFLAIVHQFQGAMRDTQHYVTNTLIQLDGPRASAQSYVIAQHVIEREGERLQLVVGARYLDRFEQRNGIWKLSFRGEVMEWARMVPIEERWFEENTELPKGQRDRDDSSKDFLDRIAWMRQLRRPATPA